MRDQRDRAARLEDVEDRLRDPLTFRPVEGLAKGDEAKRAEIQPDDLLRPRADPSRVANAELAGSPGALREHVRVGVEADGF